MSTTQKHLGPEGNTASTEEVADVVPLVVDANDNLGVEAALTDNFPTAQTLEVGSRSNVANRGFPPASTDKFGNLWFSNLNATLSYPLPSVEVGVRQGLSVEVLDSRIDVQRVAHSELPQRQGGAPVELHQPSPRQEVVNPRAAGEVTVPEWQKAEEHKRAIATIEDPKATFQQKATAFAQLYEKGEKGADGRVKVALKDGGSIRSFEIERMDLGKGVVLMHVFSPDQSGQQRPVLRWVDRNGTVEHQKNGSAKVDFHGNWWGANVTQSTVSQYAERGTVTRMASLHPPEVVLPEPLPEPPSPARNRQRRTNDRYVPGAIDRSQFDRELNDPRVMAAFAGRMRTEVGSQGWAAQVAWAETVMNRAVSRNQTLMQALTGRYYPTHNPGSSNRPDLIAAIRKAWQEGTDTTSGSTGNASGSVGFGRTGRQVIRIGGEKFGYEEVDLGRGWMRKYRQLKVASS